MLRKGWLVVILGALACLAAGVIWTARLDVPSPQPWWYGKHPVVRIEVWEPGHTMATVGMTLPKDPLDTMYALGLKADISIHDDCGLDLRNVWHDLQRLPQGKKLELREDGTTTFVWIDVKDGCERAGGGTVRS
jgi:hypothetical protein